MKKYVVTISILILAGCSQQAVDDNSDQPDRASILHAVPFTSQAPFADWKDPRQQDACEEASTLMAVSWARGLDLSKEEALEEILAIAEYENETFGSNKDTSAADTASRILEGYFDFSDYEIKQNISKQQMIDALVAGDIVVMPTYGRGLGNPNFTGLGPEKHMLVVIGYDSRKDQFITNDPGTRKGKEYKYSTDTIMGAIKNYKTSGAESINGKVNEVIIISRISES